MIFRSCKCSDMHNTYTHPMCNWFLEYMLTNFKSVTKIKRISSQENMDLIYHCLSLICLGSYRSICKLCLVIPGGWQTSSAGPIPRKPRPFASCPNVSFGPTYPIYVDRVLFFFSSLSPPLHFMPLFYKVLYVSWWKYICA